MALANPAPHGGGGMKGGSPWTRVWSGLQGVQSKNTGGPLSRDPRIKQQAGGIDRR